MSIQKYLAAFSSQLPVTLVGPLFEDIAKIEEPVIFVDGGTYARRVERGITVGDGDSYHGTLDVTLENDKNFSDLAFVLRNIPEAFSKIRLAGFLGGRRDHELFNLGEVHQFLKSRRKQTSVVFDGGIISGYSVGRWRFDRNGEFSIAVIETAMLKLKGACKFPCSELTRFEPLSSLGLSNAGEGTIFLECDNPVFVLLETLKLD